MQLVVYAKKALKWGFFEVARFFPQEVSGSAAVSDQFSL